MSKADLYVDNGVLYDEKNDCYINPDTGEVLNHKGRRLNALGQELPSPIPMEKPLGYIEQPPLHELIRSMVLQYQQDLQARTDEELETLEESEDFDVGDDMFDPSSPYEEQFNPPEGPPPADDPLVQPSPEPAEPVPPSAAP